MSKLNEPVFKIFDFMQSHIAQLHDMQQQLNLRIGYDTLNFEGRRNWTYNYLQALSDEIVEAKNCISWKWWTKESKENGQFSVILDSKNLKIEVIDILHFLLSLDLVTDFSYDFSEYKTQQFVVFNSANINWLLFRTLDDFLYDVQRGKDSLGIFSEDVYEKVLYSQHPRENLPIDFNIRYWTHFITICNILNLSDDEVADIYYRKNKINFERQDNDYSMLTKTETDNEQLKESICL